MYYVNERWLGGMLTNFKTISEPYRRDLKDIEDNGKQTALSKYCTEEGSYRSLRLELGKVREKSWAVSKI